MPLWLAGAPFALAYAVIARQAGLNALEIQLMSLVVYSAATQIAVTQLWSGGASAWTILITIIAVNLHFLLYGLSLTKRIKLSRFGRILTPFFLTDTVYAIAIAEQENTNFAFLFGVELSLFLSWNLFTALGILFGSGLIDLQAAHLDFVAPVTFFVLLISVLQSRLDCVVAVFAAGIAGLCLTIGLGNVTVIVVGIAAPLIGIFVGKFQKRPLKAL